MGTDLWRAHIHTGSSRLRSQSRYAKCKTLSFSPRRFAPVRLGFAKTSSGRDVCALMYTRSSSSIAHGWIYQDTAALLEAVKMLGESEDKVERLWSNVDYLNKGFTALGFDIGTHTVLETRAQTQTCVLPLFCALDLNRFNTGRDTLPNQAPDTFENKNVAPFFRLSVGGRAFGDSYYSCDAGGRGPGEGIQRAAV